MQSPFGGFPQNGAMIFYTGFTRRGFDFYAGLLYSSQEVNQMKIYIVEMIRKFGSWSSMRWRAAGFRRRAFPAPRPFIRRCPDACRISFCWILCCRRGWADHPRKLRTRMDTRDVPIILVTAKGSELDTVRGLDLGADDYLPKPFGIMELISRVKARLRGPAPHGFRRNTATAGFICPRRSTWSRWTGCRWSLHIKNLSY